MATTAAGAGPQDRHRDAVPASVDPPAPEAAPFTPERPYRISGSVSVRPESFGALVYDFHTRRLSFLKTRPLVRVVEGLADHPDVHSALEEAGVAESEREQYLTALAGLARAGTIKPRESA